MDHPRFCVMTWSWAKKEAGSIFSTFEKVNHYYFGTIMIETSFLYHSFGIRDVVGTRCEYKGTKTIIHVRPRRTLLCCPQCHSYTLLKNGTRARQIQTLPIGSRRCYLKLTNQRYKCASCHWNGWQKISGILKGKSYTYQSWRIINEKLILVLRGEWRT